MKRREAIYLKKNSDNREDDPKYQKKNGDTDQEITRNV